MPARNAISPVAGGRTGLITWRVCVPSEEFTACSGLKLQPRGGVALWTGGPGKSETDCLPGPVRSHRQSTATVGIETYDSEGARRAGCGESQSKRHHAGHAGATPPVSDRGRGYA